MAALVIVAVLAIVVAVLYSVLPSSDEPLKRPRYAGWLLVLLTTLAIAFALLLIL